MAEKIDRLPENVPGPWYVDSTCLPCLRCLDQAGPDTPTPLLKPNEDESYVFFTKQPESEAEIAAAELALEVCPQQAIGKDG
jgi:ferredoxin